MKAILLYLLTFIPLTITASYGKALEPLEVARQIFGKTTFTDLKRHSTDE